MTETKKYQPTITDTISLEMPTRFVVSPKGDKVAYVLSKTNWKKNNYDSITYIYYVKNKQAMQLTRSGRIADMKWVDNMTLKYNDTASGEEITVKIIPKANNSFQLSEHTSPGN